MTHSDDKVNPAQGIPFWRAKPLDALTRPEWESLCDGCGRCCLLKLEDEDSGEIHYTNIACQLLDEETCHCSNYKIRTTLVPSCLALTPDLVRETGWLPQSCAYRLVAEGRDLYWWHPLISGDPETVIAAGISVRGRTVCEDDVPITEYEDYLADWPAAGAEL